MSAAAIERELKKADGRLKRCAFSEAWPHLDIAQRLIETEALRLTQLRDELASLRRAVDFQEGLWREGKL